MENTREDQKEKRTLPFDLKGSFSQKRSQWQRSQKTAWVSVSGYKGKYYGTVGWALISLPQDVHIQTGYLSSTSHPASHSLSASSYIWVPVWDLKSGGWPINLAQESLPFQLGLEGKLSLYPGNFGKSSCATWEDTNTNLLLQKQGLLRWLLPSPCLCNHIFSLTKGDIIDAMLQSVLQENYFQFGSTLIYLLACFLPSFTVCTGLCGGKWARHKNTIKFFSVKFKFKGYYLFQYKQPLTQSLVPFPLQFNFFHKFYIYLWVYLWCLPEDHTPKLSSTSCGQGSAALTPFLPYPLPPRAAVPAPLPTCLWASAPAGFCGYGIFLPLSSMASSGQHVLQARWGFSKACVGKVPKGSPWHHRRLGAACSRKARQLQSLKYKPSLCALTVLDLLHFYWTFTKISEEV